MQNFESLGLSTALLKSLKDMQFSTPTPIQAQAIPVALQGRDILGSAQTGTGKTAAYGIPAVSHLLASRNSQVLVLTPTRELATQVHGALRQIMGGSQSPVNSVLLIGGEPMYFQLKELKRRPRLIIGTPGRINDHLERGSLNLEAADFLVLDETDRMLDMGFSIQLQQIAKSLPSKKQTLMFSATMPPGVAKIAEQYLNDPLTINVGTANRPVEKIKQQAIRTTEREKYDLLLKQLDQYSGSVIIFVKMKVGAEALAQKLSASGHLAEAIHGDLRQRCRDRAINNFRKLKKRILVATDVASRGLDVPHVGCVVNYDLPQCPEDYIHRIGRTGRAGAEGEAINFITASDGLKWRNICQLIDPQSVPRHAQKQQQRYGRGGGGPSRQNKGAGFKRRGSNGGQKESAHSNRGPRKHFVRHKERPAA